MIDVRQIEWRNQQAHARYPFRDDATLVGPSLTLENDWFVDACLFPASAGEGNLRLSAIERTTTGLLFEISDAVNMVVARGQLAETGEPDVISLTDPYGRAAGLLVITEIGRARFRSLQRARHVFTDAQTGFLPVVQHPSANPGIKMLVLDQSTGFTGDVYLVGERGVELWADEDAIRVDVVGDAWHAVRECLAEEDDIAVDALLARRALRTINRIGPDERGDFQITVGGQLAATQTLRIVPGSNMLLLTSAK